MEIISSFLTTALGYILKGAASSKTANKAKDELLDTFWSEIRPWFIEDIPDIEETANTEKTEKKAVEKLLELIEKDEKFLKLLLEKVEALKEEGVKEKNIVYADIKNVKRIKIGDKIYAANDKYDRKNIVKGNIEDADEFILGDGH